MALQMSRRAIFQTAAWRALWIKALTFNRTTLSAIRISLSPNAVLIGGLVGDVVNLVAQTMGTLAGTTNALGWSTVLIYLFAAVGSGYFLMARTSRLSHP